jgi:hypothetical protein
VLCVIVRAGQGSADVVDDVKGVGTTSIVSHPPSLSPVAPCPIEQWVFLDADVCVCVVQPGTKVTAAVDIYALGILMHELYTRQRPFSQVHAAGILGM